MKEWQELRVKDMASLGSGSTPKSSNLSYYEDGVFPWLNTSDVQDKVIVRPKYYLTQKAIDECTGLKVYPSGTLLIAMYGGGTIGNVGLMSFPARINQACCAMVFNKRFSPKFMFYAFQDKKDEIVSFGFGGSQVNLSQGQVSRFSFMVPPLSVQSSIVSYLDAKTAKIDHAIDLLQKKLDAYTRLKTSVINRAVTRGLNPNAPLKDSGIKWIGLIPEGWKVKRVKDIALFIGSGTTPASNVERYYDSNDYLWINTGDFNNNEVDSCKQMISQSAVDEIKGLRFYPVDTILVAMYGASIGKIGYLKSKATINQACCAIVANSVSVSPKFLFYLFINNKNIYDYPQLGD